jgi:hypothetical protein
MAISAGDAVLKFLGDTTNVDAAFASLGPKTKAAVAPATEAMGDLGDAAEDAGKTINKIPPVPPDVPESARMTARAMREARGEVGLIGEEIGIRLPRHVRNFVAELPGVGSALSAAFSATAVLFLVKALAEGAEKLSAWAGGAFIFTKAMKEQYDLLVTENHEIAKQSELFNKAQSSLQALTDLRTPYEKLQDVLKQQNAELDRLAFKQSEYARTTAGEDQARARALQEQIQLTEAQIVTQALADKDKNNADRLKELQQEIELRKRLAETEVTSAQVVNGLNKENADEVRYLISLKALQALASAESKFGKDSENKVRELNATIEELQAQHALKTTEELSNEKQQTLKLLGDMQKSIVEAGGVQIVQPKNMQELLRFREEAKELGITLGVDLVAKINLAKKALEDYTSLGGKDSNMIVVLKEKIQQLEKEYDNLGKVQDKEKLKSETTWAGFVQDIKKGISASHELAVDTQGAFNSLSSGLQNAFQMAISGQQGYGKALEEATAKALQSLAAQAAVKALFYTAEGFAELAFGVTSSSAAELFEAAGIMAAVAGAAGVAGHALGGGGSSNSSAQQNYAGSSNTQGSGQRGGTSVRGFAEGGLISAPTLAMIAENPGTTEAILPLDDDKAMARIGATVARHVAAAGGGGGGGDIHVHVAGMISPDNLTKVVAQINRRVGRGQTTLKASSSLRINKRSA